MIEFLPPARKINRVFIHCSASDNPKHDSISVIRDWHVNGNKWKDIGYHYFIQANGNIQMGRPLSEAPAAQKGHNTGTIAICLHGHKKFTQSQFVVLAELCYAINEKLDVTFHGHKEVDAGKECPVFDYKAVLNLDEKGRLCTESYKVKKPTSPQHSERSDLSPDISPEKSVLQRLLTVFSRLFSR
jgi:N-acetylmuramoyl-L-alanine amidase